MSTTGPLAGVRVVDLTDGQGRYGAKALAEMGADVVRVAPGVEVGPSLEPASDIGLLQWWYDANTNHLPLVLDDAGDAETFRSLVARADILIEDTTPGHLERLGLGVEALAALNPRLVQVSLTPFGATGPRADWHSSDLVAQAQSGHLSVTGDVDRPVVLWGRQSAAVGGHYAAVSALAGLHRANTTGEGAWIDLSLHEALISVSEHLLMYWWYPEVLAPLGAPVAVRQRSLHWVRAFEVVPCERGACMISPAAGGLLGLIAWLKERGLAQDVPDEPDAATLLGLVPAMMQALHEAALQSDATELFLAGQSLHVPFGESYSVPQVAQCPQHEYRGYFRPVPGHESIRLPGPVAQFSATPGPEPSAPVEAASPSEVLDRWPAHDPAVPDGAVEEGSKPLQGIRVLDFTHVLAGPFATRLFADLGADVIRVQTDERSAGTADNAFPYNLMWARSKRSVQLAMKHEGALEVLRGLVEQADVVIDNFSAGVMESWGAGPEQLARWNPKIITMSMSGCGNDGPWREFVTYAPTVHALCGFTALTGPPGETDCGPGVAYNDHISGLTGAAALLAALNQRDQTGQGQHIEISQLEVGTHVVGPALIDYFATGREARSEGNRDPFASYLVNDVFPAAEGTWVAVTMVDGEQWAPVGAELGLENPGETFAAWIADHDAADVVERLQGLGVAAGLVADAPHLSGADPQLAHRDWLRTVDSSLVGSQTTERYPARWYRADGSRELDLDYSGSPYLGEHNFEVYPQLLGWDEARVAEALGDELLM